MTRAQVHAVGLAILLLEVAAGAEAQQAHAIHTCGATGQGVVSDSAAIHKCLNESAQYRSIYFPPGYYYFDSPVDVPSGATLFGAGGASVISHQKKAQGAHDKLTDKVPFALFTVAGKTDVAFKSLTFEAWGFPTQPDNGHGIRVSFSERIVVNDCSFLGFSAGRGGTAIDLFVNNSDIQILENRFVSASRRKHGQTAAMGNTTADILAGAGNRNVIVANNLLNTLNKSGIYVNSYGTKPGSVIVASNIVRMSGLNAAHCILGTYGVSDGNAETVIANNVLEGCPWNGVYLAGPGGGTTVVSGNVIRASGRTMYRPTSGLSAGIWVAHRGGTTITDNNLSLIGYERDGTERAPTHGGVRPPGIRLNTAHNVVVRGNYVYAASGDGIALGNGHLIENIDIVDNRLVSVSTGIAVVGAVYKHLNIIGNVIDQRGMRNAAGIYAWTLDQSNESIRINHNRLIGGGGTGSAGVYFAHGFSGSVDENDVGGYPFGIQLVAFAGAGVGRSVSVSGNHLSENGVGVRIDSNDPAQPTLLGLNRYTNNMVDTQGSGATLYVTRQTYPNVEVYGDSVPSLGYWKQGDRVLFTAPSSGGSIGAVCVSSGRPGTWRSFGQIQ